MKKNIIAASVVAAALALSACSSQPVDQPDSSRPEGTWNSVTGTLSDVRYYDSSAEQVYKAAEKALRDLGIFVTGYTPYKNGWTLYGRAVGDYKVTVEVSSRTVSTKGTDRAPIPYTEVSVSYGTWGDLASSLQIISKISSNLPSSK